jgi:hypothetical protein
MKEVLAEGVGVAFMTASSFASLAAWRHECRHYAFGQHPERDSVVTPLASTPSGVCVVFLQPG